MSNYSKENLQNSSELHPQNTPPPTIASASIDLSHYEVRVGKYKYDEEDQLGTGFSSHVYKGVEIDDTTKRYAIKVINLKNFRGHKLELLETEIDIHRSLNHENIVKLHQVIKTSNNYYLIMEYCPHGSLSEYIHQKKLLTESNAIEIVKQIISAYKYLLGEGVLHRDIKPANILRLGKKWKLADFGFGVRSRLGFKDKSNMGTPLYMAPQSIKRCFYSYKSDFYSIGVVLYQMIVGETPHQVDTQKQLMSCLENQVVLPKHVKNNKISEFIHKACRITDSKRMGREQFKSFQFDDSNTEQPLKQSLSRSASISFGNVKFSNITADSVTSSYKQIPEQSIFHPHPHQQSCKSIIFQNQQSNTTKSPMVVNAGLLRYELQYVHHYYFTVQNINHFQVSSPNKQMYCLVLFKLLLKILKQLCDKDRNCFQLESWEQYRLCKLHQEMHTLFTTHSQKYQKEFLEFIKYNDIKIIRDVNRKFPELSKETPLSSKFYENLRIFLADIIKQHRNWLEEQSQGAHLNGEYEALNSVCAIYRLCQVRSCSAGAIVKERLNLIKDYSKSTRNKINCRSSSLKLSL